jgi:hypothetical protein
MAASDSQECTGLLAMKGNKGRDVHRKQFVGGFSGISNGSEFLRGLDRKKSSLMKPQAGNPLAQT